LLQFIISIHQDSFLNAKDLLTKSIGSIKLYIRYEPIRSLIMNAGAASQVAKAPKAEKPKKIKVVRDSFTIPKPEFEQIDALKKRALGMGVSVKKSELLRAGLLVLRAMTDAAFKSAVANVPVLKTGRPKADKAKAEAKPFAEQSIVKKPVAKKQTSTKRVPPKPASRAVKKSPVKRVLTKKSASLK
jgi:hypothetical protein